MVTNSDAGHKARHFLSVAQELGCALTSAYEVHHDGNDCEDEQQVDGECGDVQDGKTADPQKYENDSKNEIHGFSSFLRRGNRGSRDWLQEIRDAVSTIRCLDE